MRSIVPAILALTPEDFQEKLNKVHGCAEIHIDIGDGKFVTTKTISYDVVRSADIPAQVHMHLMIEKPERVITEWLSLPNIVSISFHIESTDKVLQIVDTIHQTGKYAGLVINPETSVKDLALFVGSVDFVQFMAVHPGKYGAEFQPQVLETMATFHAEHPEVMLAIDGGVNPARVSDMVKAGAEVLISGGYVMNSSDPAQAIKEIESAIKQ